MLSSNELIQKALESTRSSVRITYLSQIYAADCVENVKALMTAAIKEPDERAKCELWRVAILCASAQPQVNEVNRCLKEHSATWESLVEPLRIEALSPLSRTKLTGVELTPSMAKCIKLFLNASETKQALKAETCMAWAITLNLKLETTDAAESYLREGSLFRPSIHATSAKLANLMVLVASLSEHRPNLFNDPETSKPSLTTTLKKITAPRYGLLMSIMQSLQWLCSQSDLTSIQQTACINDNLKKLGRSAPELRAHILSTYVTLSALGIFDGDLQYIQPKISTAASFTLGEIPPYAHKKLFIALLKKDLCDFGDVISAACWAFLACERRVFRRSIHRWLNHILWEAKITQILPSSDLLEFFKLIQATELHRHTLVPFIRFFSEDHMRHLFRTDSHAWSEWFREWLDLSILRDLTSDQVLRALTSETTPNRPVDSHAAAAKSKAAPKSAPKAKAKFAAATSRLLQNMTANSSTQPSNTLDATVFSPTEAKRVDIMVTQLEIVQELIKTWPMVCAQKESEILDALQLLLRTVPEKWLKDLNLPIKHIFETFVESYVGQDAVPCRNELPELLFELSGPRKKCNLRDAERVCATLNCHVPLSGEASTLVLPVIIALLSSEGTPNHRVSFVAVHRAINTVVLQLRLGAKMDAIALVRIMRGIMQDQPALLSLCEKIVGLLEGVEVPLNDLLALVDCENAPFRRAVIRTTLKRVGPNCDDPEILARAMIGTYDMDESIRKSILEANIDFTGVPISTCLAHLASNAPGYQKTVSRAIANHFDADESLDSLMDAFRVRFRKPDDAIPEHLKGFKLTQADLERIKAKANARQGHQVLVTNGQIGCMYALGCVARRGLLSEKSAKTIIDFIIVEASKIIKVDHEDKLEQELFKNCESAILSTVANCKNCAGSIELHLSKLVKDLTLSPVGSALGVSALGALGASHENTDITNLFIDLILDIKSVDISVKKTVVRSLPVLLRGKSKLNTWIEQAENLAFEAKDLPSKIAGSLLLAACIKAEGWQAYGGLEHLSLIASERKEYWVRYGVYLVLDALVELFGRAIEPQAKGLVVLLLSGASDNKPEIRETCEKVNRKFMKALAGSSSLKDLMPTILEFTNSTSWRAKVGALNMLARLASTTAGSAMTSEELLNQFLPILIEAAHAPHQEVRDASQRTLSDLLLSGEDSVLQHPDTKGLALPILNVLEDASDNRMVQFLREFDKLQLSYKLDSASVCIFHLLLLRALRMTSSSATTSGVRAEIRERSCHLIGVLPYLCANPERDLAPQLKREGLLNELFKLLGAPTPIVRQTCARTIGLITEVLGNSLHREILPYLIKTLKQVDNVVERSGCANALVEVFRALPPDILRNQMPDILKQAGSRQSDEFIPFASGKSTGAREGFIGLFVYFPLIYGDKFKDYVPEALPMLINGLEASEESVRDIAFRAIKIFVQQFGSSHTPLLLQPIECALYNNSPEVRLRAVGLLGSLVDKIFKGAEETTFEGGDLMQFEVLSLERRSYVLSAIFIVRCGDEDVEVRHAAASVWKNIVQNTPKTVKELLALLTKRLMDLLASGVTLKENAGARCMNELVAKYGDKLLNEIMTEFVKVFKKSPTPAGFRGAFIGLQSVIQSAPPLILRKHVDVLLPMFKSALAEKNATISAEIRAVSKEPVIKAITLLAASEANAIEELQSIARKNNKQKSTGKSKLTSVAVATPSLDGFLVQDAIINPIIDELVAVRDSDANDPVVDGLLETMRIFMKLDAKLVIDNIMTKCRKDDLTVVKVKLLGSMAYSNANLVVAQLRPICRIAGPGLCKLNAAGCDLENVKAELRNAFDACIATLNANDINDKVVAEIIDMLELCEARMVCTTVCWDELVNEHPPCPEICSAETMIAVTELDDREPREGSDWGRWAVVCLTSSLYKCGAQTELWQKGVTTTIVPLLLPLALYDLNRHTVEEGALWLQNMTKALDRTLLVPVAVQIWRCLRQAVSQPIDNEIIQERIQIPGLQHKLGIEALVSVLQPALLYGNAEIKEKASEAFELLVSYAGATALSGVAVKVAGQLIRGFAEKTTSAVKLHILASLTELLAKVGTPLRLLVPQLQSSFVRCIGEPELGLQAAKALTLLSGLAGPRVNLLVSELAKSLTPHSANEASLQAIVGVLQTAGTSMTPATLTQLKTNLCAVSTGNSDLTEEAISIIDVLLD